VNSTVTKALRHLTSSNETTLPPREHDKDILARQWLANALVHLPTRERLALALCYQEGLSCEEMAAVLGIATDEAEQLHARALSRLASRIGDHEQERDDLT
jgi:RNA polymerase sigma factor (sigma-70 family)